LFSHFGKAGEGPVLFELNKFKKSFHELFLHLKRNDLRLTSDFLFLGIYLVTLYLSMSKLGEPLDVKNGFIKVWERNEKHQT